MMRSARLSAAFLVLLVLLGAGGAEALGQAPAGAEALGQARAGAAFTARLSVVPIDPATAATVTGQGRAAAELDGRRLTIEGSFEGLQGAATAAHLHRGAYTGVRGDPIAELEVESGTSGRVTGSVELTRDQVEALRAGRLYVQIHSESAPDGNLWGWLLP